MESNRLYRTIKGWYGNRAYTDLKGFFGKTGLPPPRAQDYQALHNNEGYLFFLNAVGLSCKITRDSVAHIKNDYIIQPIASYDMRSFRVEFFSGLECPVQNKDLTKLIAKLETYGIEMFDTQVLNAGYLPYKTKEFPRGVPVVLDIGAVYQNGIAPKGSGKTPIQNKVYGDLKRAFKSALKEKTPRRCQASLNETWAHCAAMKADNKLTSSWLTADHSATRHRGIIAQSLSYEDYTRIYFKTVRTKPLPVMAHPFKGLPPII